MFGADGVDWTSQKIYYKLLGSSFHVRIPWAVIQAVSCDANNLSQTRQTQFSMPMVKLENIMNWWSSGISNLDSVSTCSFEPPRGELASCLLQATQDCWKHPARDVSSLMHGLIRLFESSQLRLSELFWVAYCVVRVMLSLFLRSFRENCHTTCTAR